MPSDPGAGDPRCDPPCKPHQGPECLNGTLGGLEARGLFLAEVDCPKLDRAHGLTLEIGDSPGDGNPQQLHHLHASIPLLINTETSRAAFHQREKQLMVSVPLLPVSSFQSPLVFPDVEMLVYSLELFQFEKKTARAAERRDDASAMSGWAASAVATLGALLC